MCLQIPAAPFCPFMPSSQSLQRWLFIEKQPDDVPQKLELLLLLLTSPTAAFALAVLLALTCSRDFNCELLRVTCDFKGPAVSGNFASIPRWGRGARMCEQARSSLVQQVLGACCGSGLCWGAVCVLPAAASQLPAGLYLHQLAYYFAACSLFTEVAIKMSPVRWSPEGWRLWCRA